MPQPSSSSVSRAAWFGLARFCCSALWFGADHVVDRSTARTQLGRLHTPNVAVLADLQVKDTGLHRYVRHPSYLGALIAFVGVGFALGNGWSLLLIVLVTPAMYLHRIREEELALTEGLGAPYREYFRCTKRLIPGIY